MSEPAITITTHTPTEAQNWFARDALRSQRGRLLDLFASFEDDVWNAPTRCPEWSVHDVVRHLCDINTRWTGLLQGEPLERIGIAGIDPRTSPLEWLESSSRDRPDQTLKVFEQTSAALLDEVDQRIERHAGDTIPFVYGNAAWSAMVLHVFWDAWVHERDILVPQGRTQESPAIESRAAAGYGLAMAGVPLTMLGRSIDETVVLEGPGGGVFHLTAGECGAAVSVIEHDGDRPDALRGSLADAVDSMVGREPGLTDALRGPAQRAEKLGTLRRFMLMPTG